MNTNVTDAAGNTLGYYYWCNLSKCIIAVKADGTRASVQHAFQAERWIEG